MTSKESIAMANRYIARNYESSTEPDLDMKRRSSDSVVSIPKSPVKTINTRRRGKYRETKVHPPGFFLKEEEPVKDIYPDKYKITIGEVGARKMYTPN
jgi:hypothetical protein